MCHYLAAADLPVAKRPGVGDAFSGGDCRRSSDDCKGAAGLATAGLGWTLGFWRVGAEAILGSFGLGVPVRSDENGVFAIAEISPAAANLANSSRNATNVGIRMSLEEIQLLRGANENGHISTQVGRALLRLPLPVLGEGVPTCAKTGHSQSDTGLALVLPQLLSGSGEALLSALSLIHI